jgi:hypothetical protein
MFSGMTHWELCTLSWGHISSGSARLQNLGGGGAFEGQTQIWGGGQDIIFKKVLLFAHAVVTELSPPRRFTRNTLGISPPFRIFAPHICNMVYSNNFVILSSY